MKSILNIAVLTFLLAAAPLCFALREIAPITTAEAKAMGIEVRAKAAGPDAVWLELEFKPEGISWTLVMPAAEVIELGQGSR